MRNETSRAFWKNKVYGDLYAVEVQGSTQEVLAASKVDPATACAHSLAGYELSLDEAETLTNHRRDFDVFHPRCVDATHLLADIGAAEKECQLAEEQFKQHDATAKAAKKVYEAKADRLRSLVREATEPKPLPLLDAATPAA